jgi:hypothetical protein
VATGIRYCSKCNRICEGDKSAREEDGFYPVPNSSLRKRANFAGLGNGSLTTPCDRGVSVQRKLRAKVCRGAQAQSEIDWGAGCESACFALFPLSRLRRPSACSFGGFACSRDSWIVPTLTTQASPASPASAEADSNNFFLLRSVSFLAAAFSAAYKASSWALGLIWLAWICIRFAPPSQNCLQ